MAEIGAPVSQDITRTEDDTDDITIHLTNADGTDADVTGWTAEFSIGLDDNTPMSPAQVYSGTGIAGGLIPINMDGFNILPGSYKYDIRITDTVTGDTPARVYFKGKLKVTNRIN